MNHSTKSIVCVLVLSLLAVSTAHAGLTDNLELYSPINSTDVLDDEIGTNDGSLVGAASVIRDPTAGSTNRGEVLSVNGNDANYGDYGNVLNPMTNNYTVSVWFNIDSATTATQFIASKGNSGSGSPAWGIYFSGSSITLRCCSNLVTTDGTTTIYDRAGLTKSDVTRGEWHHVALVIDNDTGILNGYLDGAWSGAAGNLNGWSSGGGGAPDNFFTAGETLSTTYPILLGRRRADGAPLNGMVDDFAIWSRALTGNEIQGIYEGDPIVSVPEPGTIALLTGMLLAGLALWRRH